MAKRRSYRSDLSQLSLFGGSEPVEAPSDWSTPCVRRSCALGHHIWAKANQLSFDGKSDFEVEYCSCCGLQRRA